MRTLSLLLALTVAAPAADLSLAQRFARLPADARARILAETPPEARAKLRYSWRLWARPKQIAPEGNWRVWLLLAGRGFGKTRTGAEWVREQVESGRCGRLALVARTASDARDVMVEGESGLLAISPRGFRPVYEPSKRRLKWPNGAIATTYSADEPDALRGPQHDGGWADEPAHWKYAETTWSNLMFGLRLGKNPRLVATTTPRPTPLIKRLVKSPTTHVTPGTTYENRDNLAEQFFSEILTAYEGTRLGRQELEAELLEDTPGALWTLALIDELRVDRHPPLIRVVIPVDPAVTSNEGSAETGIVPVGVGECSCKVASGGKPELHGFVLDDLSDVLSPNAWAERAVNGMRTHQGDRIVGEVNNGGDLVEVNIRTVDKNVAYKAVHASRGKRTRAEPVAALYEQKKVHHVGTFAKLEDQQCTWVPESGKKSPDRMDALVWGLTELMLGGTQSFFLV